MDVTTISQLIGSLGFPIVACLYMAKLQEKQNEQHSKEVAELRKSVDNNTNAMIKLCTKLGVDVDIKEDL
jgi:hypothetical protein